MRGSPTAQASVAIVCVILGALLMLQYQAHGSIVKAKMAEFTWRIIMPRESGAR